MSHSTLPPRTMPLRSVPFSPGVMPARRSPSAALPSLHPRLPADRLSPSLRPTLLMTLTGRLPIWVLPFRASPFYPNVQPSSVRDMNSGNIYSKITVHGCILARPTWRRMKKGTRVHCAPAVHAQVVSTLKNSHAPTGQTGVTTDPKLAGHMHTVPT